VGFLLLLYLNSKTTKTLFMKKVLTLLLLFFSIFSAKAQGIITTVAGNGINGYSGDGGLATAAMLRNPTGVAVDASGNLYIADYINNRIRKVSPSGIIITIAGTGTFGYSGDGGPATSAQFANPRGVAVDGSGNLYIADLINHRIRKVNLITGIITTVAGRGAGGYSGDGSLATAAQLSFPSGVAVDGSGNLYIGDNGNNRIRKVNLGNGIITTVAGNGTVGYSGDNGPATSAQLSGPAGVAVDGSNLYIADGNNYRIRKVNLSTGIITLVAGNGAGGYSGDGGLATAAQLYAPEGVVVDGSGNLYIAEINNNRVRKVNLSTGIITTVAGNGTVGYSGDGGPATSAQLTSPTGVAVDGSGNLYIAASGSIRKVSFPTGPTITTSALSATTYCQGATLNVSFTTTGTFSQDAFFFAELSDASGSFASPLRLGAVPVNFGGSINATIPANQTPGTGYRIRVVSINPSVTGSDNGTNITIAQSPVLTIHTPTAVCAPATTNLTDAAITQGSSLPNGSTLTYFTNATATIAVADPTKVGPGTYYIKAATPAGCTTIQSVTVPPSPSTVAAPTSSGDQVVCQTSPIQTLTSMATAGANATLAWYNAPSGGSVVANPILNAVGTITYYAASIANSGYCDAATRTPVTLTIKAAPQLTSTLTPPATNCTAAFSYTPTSSVASTTFSWSRAAVSGISNAASSGTGSISETLTNTTNAPINVTYVYSLSSNGCSSLNPYNVVVTVNPCTGDCIPPTFIKDGTIVRQPTCGQSNGAIYLIPTSGMPPFQYSINGGQTYSSGPVAGTTFDNLSAGTYQLRIKDAGGCEAQVVTVTLWTPNCPVTSLPPLSTNCTAVPTFINNGTIVRNPTCGQSNGAIDLIPTAGTAPFYYSVDGGKTYYFGPAAGLTIQGLSAGVYQLKIRDGKGCESQVVAMTLWTPNCPVTSLPPASTNCTTMPTFINNGTIVRNPTCGQSNGVIYLIPTLGTAPFYYSVDGGKTYYFGPAAGLAIEGLPAGTYQLKIRDANNCESQVATRTLSSDCATVQQTSSATEVSIVVGKAALLAYPNPTSGQFKVQLRGLVYGKLQVTVLNSKGQVVEQRNITANENSTFDMNLTDKAKGVYFIRVASEKGVQLTKILVQ
jgi:sugar lactone lactonase YvrE